MHALICFFSFTALTLSAWGGKNFSSVSWDRKVREQHPLVMAVYDRTRFSENSFWYTQFAQNVEASFTTTRELRNGNMVVILNYNELKQINVDLYTVEYGRAPLKTERRRRSFEDDERLQSELTLKPLRSIQFPGQENFDVTKMGFINSGEVMIFSSEGQMIKFNVNETSFLFSNERSEEFASPKVYLVPAAVNREISDSNNELADYLYYSNGNQKTAMVALNGFSENRFMGSKIWSFNQATQAVIGSEISSQFFYALSLVRLNRDDVTGQVPSPRVKLIYDFESLVGFKYDRDQRIKNFRLDCRSIELKHIFELNACK